MVWAVLMLCAGCRKNLTEFTFIYSMESVNNYKLLLTFKGDKTYKIEEYNYFLDNHAKRQAPIIRESVLTEEEYNEVVNHLSACNFFKMKDSYGFEKEADPELSDVMYQITFITDGKEKYISIRNSDDNLFPSSFINLLKHINTFLREHKASDLP
jgi:hypothetical protein